jgi:hypothetical protein
VAPPRRINPAKLKAAHQMFRRMRWPDTEGAPVCPNCSCAGYGKLHERDITEIPDRE